MQASNKNPYRARELSWLSFNERVLQQANNPDTPLMERIKFLAIYSNNLDEFFRVRVATLKRLTKIDNKVNKVIGHKPSDTIETINKIVSKQKILYETTQDNIREELKKNKIELINETELSPEQEAFLKIFFKTKLQNSIMPIMLYNKKNIPDLVDDNIYFAVKIIQKKQSKSPIYSIIQLPTHKYPRFMVLPKKGNMSQIIYLDDIIRLGLPNVFYFTDYQEITAHTFKITKDAELDIEDDISATYLELIEKSIKKRKKGNTVRFSYDKDMSEDLLEHIKKVFKIKKTDSVFSGGRYHNTKDLIKFPNLLGDNFKYVEITNIPIPICDTQKNFFETLQKQDILLHYPYHSFNYYINFLKDASIDQNVVSIKICLYRLSKNSDVIDALLNAIRNGKKVTVILELQARFDEQANLAWSEILTDAGVKVIHGVPGLKVHSKLTLIKRIENKKIKYYTAIGTGNYNETTAKLYTDLCLLTGNKKINSDIVKLFDFLKNNYKHFSYNNLLVSPFNSRKSINKLIDNEIKNAKKGKPAYIHIKINNIDDRAIINKLYTASQQGVEIILLVRGMFSLITDIKDISDKIIARGIVDRYLEHSRIFIFCNNKKNKVYITSADLMTRNIDRRIEVATPIIDDSLKKQIIDIFDIYAQDNTSARILDKDLTNKMYTNNEKQIQAQIEVYNYLKNIKH